MPAQFTPCPGGFVTAVPLPGGRILVEGWTLTSDGDGGAQHENAFRWTAPDEQDAAATVAEFAASLAAKEKGEAGNRPRLGRKAC